MRGHTRRAARDGARARRTTRPTAGLAVLVAAALLVALAACGGGSTATDGNEPNDEVGAATPLVAGYPLEGVLTAGDSDVFGSEAPAGAGEHAFVVTVLCDDPANLEVNVGASIPGVWEGITWPGWEPAVSGDHVTVSGGLREGHAARLPVGRRRDGLLGRHHLGVAQ